MAGEGIQTYRASAAPSLKVPFGLRSAGHFHLPPGWTLGPVVKPVVQVMWGVAGSGTV
jgi:hypothetical protein